LSQKCFIDQIFCSRNSLLADKEAFCHSFVQTAFFGKENFVQQIRCFSGFILARVLSSRQDNERKIYLNTSQSNLASNITPYSTVGCF
ncbi:MAG: hypothetical protein MR660_06055, partial [Peptoniphilaceae bacterium]|nr:hypothetical protein [Peptoniphilaceae bacterium]